MSETLTTMLAAMPDGYQKTVGFPTYDLLAAASIPMEELAEELARTREMLDPSTLTGTDLDNYIKSRSGLVPTRRYRECVQFGHNDRRLRRGNGRGLL